MDWGWDGRSEPNIKYQRGAQTRYNIAMRTPSGKMMPCDKCGKKVFRVSSAIRLYKKHFCSKECRAKGEFVRCTRCDQRIWKKMNKIKANTSGKFFCDWGCLSGMSEEKGKMVTCSSCKGRIWKPLHVVMNNKTEKFFCDKKCKSRI
jgi:hypothetical protein